MNIAQMIKETKPTFRNPRSVPLTKSEIGKLKQLRTEHKTNTECASFLGLDRVVYDRVVVYGSASFTTVQKIRQKLADLADHKDISKNTDTK